MRLRIGNQTACSAASPLDPFEFAVAAGFDAFEFFPDRGPSGRGGWMEGDLDAGTRQAIRQRAAAAGIQLSVHAPLDWDLLREPAGERLDRVMAFTTELGAVLINLHLELGHGLEAFVAALEPACRRTAEAGVRLAVENTVYTGPEDFNRFFTALGRCRALPITHVGMTFDLGHANLYAATRNNYWRYLDALTPIVPLAHLHLHENFGDRDSHLPLFTGPARDNPSGIQGMVERLERRGFAGCAILEQWPQPPSLLVEARDGLARMAARGGPPPCS